MRVRVVVAALALSIAFALARPAAGQPSNGRPRTYGTSVDSILTVGSWEFDVEDSIFRVVSVGGGDPNGRYVLGASACFDASVHLPGGSYIDFFELVGCDTSSTPDEEVNAGLFICDLSSNCHLAGNPLNVARTSGAPGCTLVASDVIAETVDNSANLYTLRVCTTSGNSSTYFRAVRIWYRLQVSPAPATATFADVPTNHIYFRAIEALAKSGITSGCGNGNFCPSQAVTRGELAKFLANALGLQSK